jgi:hypothetical protein
LICEYPHASKKRIQGAIKDQCIGPGTRHPELGSVQASAGSHFIITRDDS